MKYSGTYPSVTAIQVGAAAYVVFGNQPKAVTVQRTSTKVTNGAEEITYYFTEIAGIPFKSVDVFASKSDIKTDFQTDVDAL